MRINKMSKLAALSIFEVAILIVSLFSIIYAYKKDKRGRVDSPVAFLTALPGFIGLTAFITFLIPIYTEYTKQEELKAFNAGDKVFWCPKSKDSNQMARVALSDGFIYDGDKDMFINQKTQDAYVFSIGDGRECR
jgi:hypothetical protein